MQGVPPLKLGGPPGMLLVNTAWNNNWLRTVHSKTIEFLSNSQSYNKPLINIMPISFYCVNLLSQSIIIVWEPRSLLKWAVKQHPGQGAAQS